MTPADFRIARPDDLCRILDWAAAEGWNPGLDDAPAFHAADPDGVFVAEIAGAPVAAISVVNHCDRLAFLGLYICHPDHRGRGIGFALWTRALEHAGTRTVGLDGVAAQEGNYAKSGFVRLGATRRFEGRPEAAEAADVRPFRPDDQERIEALDTAANGFDRPAFLSAWLERTEHRRTLVLHDATGPTGFVTARRCRDGVKLGPIVAPDAEAALVLIRAAAAAMPEAPVIVDLPSANTALSDRLGGLGFVETFATARMYRGAPPKATARLQAIATMELG